MENLAVKPIQFVPIKPSASFINPIKIKYCCCLLKVETFSHAFRRRPTQ